MRLREYLCTAAMTICLARLAKAPKNDFVDSTKLQSTDAADKNVPWPVKTICVISSRKTRVKTVFLLDAKRPS
ncbi:hypothetical protein BU14_0308s0001 [Porphyra umbilicalis]|uniref:Uncharacterized protein n=1 Tax=Porphyra umbilicalis TaxID=2786 RepID=A0A1X6P0C9_PORUM|nr:hypothetical protein BU14_0308s0001 [Porphyra umbilicalis]|eukprot:OSX74083.1 hypothetical protein BU14_0308s0001 [Porphyra umbilicalis]